MLVFNPHQRISVQAALQHPYLSRFYDPADARPVSAFDTRFDIPDEQLTQSLLRMYFLQYVELRRMGYGVEGYANGTSNSVTWLCAVEIWLAFTRNCTPVHEGHVGLWDHIFSPLECGAEVFNKVVFYCINPSIVSLREEEENVSCFLTSTSFFVHAPGK